MLTCSFFDRLMMFKILKNSIVHYVIQNLKRMKLMIYYEYVDVVLVLCVCVCEWKEREAGIHVDHALIHCCDMPFFQLVAAVLHIGNITFRATGERECTVSFECSKDYDVYSCCILYVYMCMLMVNSPLSHVGGCQRSII